MRNKTAGAVAYCDTHGKLLWPDRKTARAVAREHHDDRKSVYHCSVPEFSHLFHVGHLAPEVKRGTVSRSDRYYRNAS
jgi:hypothetical protein